MGTVTGSRIAASPMSRRVLRAMSIFGGVQAVSILCSIVRTKLVAMWIGPLGVGLFGIFLSASDLIGNISQMGLSTSSTRAIASAPESRRPSIIATVRRLALALGILGGLLTLIAAPWLSEISFGSDSFTAPYRLLALTALTAAVSAGENGVLQGLSHLRPMARAAMWGNLTGLCASVPMFYWWRDSSIVPSILIYSIATTAALLIYRRSTSANVRLTASEMIVESRHLLSLGAYITVSMIGATAASYIFIAYLNRHADTDTVGYFQAGFTLINRYVGLIFTAIMVEFYPRISGAIHSRRTTSLYVSHEIATVSTVMIPVAISFIIAAPLIIDILYTPEFRVILPFVTLGCIGTIFRGVSVCLAYTILARGDGRTFVVTELTSSAAYVAVSIFAYKNWGIHGMGAAYVAWYLIYTLIVSAVYFLRYRLILKKRAALTALAAIGAATLTLALVW